MDKNPKTLWQKVKATILKKGVSKGVYLQQDFFLKAEIMKEGKIYITYSLPEDESPFLKIRQLKKILSKEQLLESCKNPVDFTGCISIFTK